MTRTPHKSIIAFANNLYSLVSSNVSPSYLFRRFHRDTLLSNSIYLMASTFVMSVFGFLFWTIATKYYTSEQIGLVTTLISITSLIAGLSLLGFNNAIVRYLPTSPDKNIFINTIFNVISIVAVFFAIIFYIGIPLFSPKLSFLQENILSLPLLAAFMIVASINSITDSVFIYFRSTQYILLINSIMSVVKIILPIFLVSFGTVGLFYSYAGGIIVAMVLSLIFISLKFSYKFNVVISKTELRRIFHYSFGNYLAQTISILPSSILPILITNMLGPKITAYFYMPSMIVALLNSISSSIAASVFAEGSKEETKVRLIFKKGTIILFGMLLPLIVLILIFGKYLLLFFGKEYSSEGYVFLQLSVINSGIGSVNYLMGSVLNVKKMVNKIIRNTIVSGVLVIVLTYLLIQYGLVGVGLAGIITQIIMVCINMFTLLRR